MYFTGDDGLQNMFAYQPTFTTVQFQKDKDTDHSLRWKSKW